MAGGSGAAERPAGALRLALTVFLPFAFGFFLSDLYRTVNAVIYDDLTAATGVGPAGLGFLTAAFLGTFAAVQLPLGVLLDRYGPRRVEAALLLIAAAGAGLFALGGDLASLALARGLIGLGVSACLMAAFHANYLWFPAAWLPFANGCILAFGGLGALAATTPVAVLAGWLGWRAVFALLAAATLAVAAALALVVPERHETRRGAGGLGAQLCGAWQVITSPVFVRAAPLAFLTQAHFLAYQGLWAGPWLAEVAGLGRLAVAHHLLAIAVAMTAGNVAVGWAAARLARRGVPVVRTAVALLVLYLAVQLPLALGQTAGALALWSAYGFLAAAPMLFYPVLSTAFPPELTGRVNTALNFLVFLGAFAIQWGAGLVIDLARAAGVEVAAAGHGTALLAVWALEAAALAWFFAPALRGRPLWPV